MKHVLLIIALLLGMSASALSPRTVTDLRDWEFSHGHPAVDNAIMSWDKVKIPHDWAIYGPFDRGNDIQKVAVKQNGEIEATWKTGRTGGLPFIGKGSYRTNVILPDTTDRRYTLIFDGAMSNAKVYVNGNLAGEWPYGYNSFHLEIDTLVRQGDNEILVLLENREQSSRWYPGAGLYRNVHLVETSRVRIPVWGTRLTTPTVNADEASVSLELKVDGLAKGQKGVRVTTLILDPDGQPVAENTTPYHYHGQPLVQNFLVASPNLWSPSSPSIYTARTSILIDSVTVDSYDTPFGIRKAEFIPEKGFFLNGKPLKFKGVCNHHDLGPLGAAINRSALRHRLAMLKEMGVNALRTSHNMPSPELVELCDRMGIMLMIEPFDDWGFKPKSPNGYGAIFTQWASRDITNMVEHFRNNPSVIMWSIGNEVPSQWGPDGVAELVMLRDLVHSLDPTRPVTCGMDRIKSVLDNGFAASLDIPGFNYKPQHYERAYRLLPQKMILGTETASTVSSRGVYHFPLLFRGNEQVLHPDHQSSSYDNEACYWSNTPEIDFAMDSDKDYVMGQFVWTGFDYLGEPTPYDTDAWPNHSSLFGIIDLASLPKDRYWLYRSQWRDDSPTLHLLPHWTWHGREGEITPVMVYTSYPKAELFINGRSQGAREKNDSTLLSRYRLIWPEVIYEPGELKVVAYDSLGNQVAEQAVSTAGKPHHLVLSANVDSLATTGDDLAYITITVADKAGNPVPDDSRLVTFKVEGAGAFEATANGDPTCLLPFQEPRMKLFSGAATAIVRGGTKAGTLRFTATAPGVKPATLLLPVN